MKRLWKAIVSYFADVSESEPTMDDIIDGLTEEQVKRYFEKNADIDLSVPLAIARQVREEITWDLSRSKKKLAADDLATMRGMLAGIAKFEDLYCAALRQQGRLRKE
jgi:hypothetical protein